MPAPVTAARSNARPAAGPAASTGAGTLASSSTNPSRRGAAGGALRANRSGPQDQALRGLLLDCRRLMPGRGEANGPGIAQAIVGQRDGLTDGSRGRFFEHLANDCSPDPQKVLAAAQAYAHAPANSAQLIHLTQAAEPPRQALFRRTNRAPGGTAALVRLRRALLDRLPRKPTLAGVEHGLLHLLSSGFNPGFLQMRKVDWTSPAQLLEQIIQHEAVHEVEGWDALRRRLQPDRRCCAFFHPQLPAEPLIFVVVALVPDQFKVAVFYSISNCQPGLRGVSLGNFLIKRVAEQLNSALPQLKTFCTLSPVPALNAWLHRLAGPANGATDDPAGPGGALAGLLPAATERALQALALLQRAAGCDLQALNHINTLSALPAAVHHALWRLAAVYLVHRSAQPGGDPVARFHLDNGARLERLNAQANLSAKGLKHSAGLMVNYLYDLTRIEPCHDRFVQDRVVHSRALSALL